MLPPLLAHLFRSAPSRLSSRTEGRNVSRSRRTESLQCELLESREVPANLIWTNSAGDGLFGTAGNWFNLDTQATALSCPVAGDDIFFDGDVSNANCWGLVSGGVTIGAPSGPKPIPLIAGEFHSVNLIDGYSGTIFTSAGFRTETLALDSGAIAQTNYVDSDITVSRTFLWTGGTLGGSHADVSHPGFVASHATLHLLGGAASVIDPGAGNSVATGSTLSFESSLGLGSTATFHTGTVNFVGGLGIVIDALSTVNAKVKPATVSFTDTKLPGAADKLIRIKTGGKMIVHSEVETAGGTFETAIPVMNYGLFQVEKQATAVVKGAIPLGDPTTNPSFYQDSASAAIKIENGSRLATEKGLSFLKGSLTTLSKADPPQGFVQSATVAGKVSLSGGHVHIDHGSDNHVFGTLVFESDVWLGAVTLHVVVDGRAPGTGDAGKSDLFDFRSSLLDGLAQPVLKVTTINVPQGGVNMNQTWEFAKTANPITALKPTVVSETPGVNYQIIDVNQNRAWWLRPVA